MREDLRKIQNYTQAKREDLMASLTDTAANLVEYGFNPSNSTVLELNRITEALKSNEELSIEDQKFILSLGISLI